MYLLALFGCGTTDATSGETAAELPSAWLYDETTSGAPNLDADAVSAGTQAVLDRVLTFNANPISRSYDEMMALADAECPPISSSTPGGGAWETNCTAESGAEFAGFVSAYSSEDGAVVRRFRAEATITALDGRRLTMAGDAESRWQAQSNGESRSSAVSGVMYYDGPAADGTWLAEDVELSLEYNLVTADGALVSLGLEGAVAGLEGEMSAVSFSDVQFSFPSGSACALEPAGTVAVRDAEGVWADLVFDAEYDSESGLTIDEPELCDGCGTLWYDGTEFGQSCVDLTALHASVVDSW